MYIITSWQQNTILRRSHDRNETIVSISGKLKWTWVWLRSGNLFCTHCYTRVEWSKNKTEKILKLNDKSCKWKTYQIHNLSGNLIFLIPVNAVFTNSLTKQNRKKYNKNVVQLASIPFGSYSFFFNYKAKKKKIEKNERIKSWTNCFHKINWTYLSDLFVCLFVQQSVSLSSGWRGCFVIEF